MQEEEKKNKAGDSSDEDYGKMIELIEHAKAVAKANGWPDPKDECKFCKEPWHKMHCDCWDKVCKKCQAERVTCEKCKTPYKGKMMINLHKKWYLNPFMSEFVPKDNNSSSIV